MSVPNLVRLATMVHRQGFVIRISRSLGFYHGQIFQVGIRPLSAQVIVISTYPQFTPNVFARKSQCSVIHLENTAYLPSYLHFQIKICKFWNSISSTTIVQLETNFITRYARGL